MGIVEHYGELVGRSRELLDALSSDSETFPEFAKAHNFSDDYEKLYEAIKDRPESDLFLAASREYRFALYALTTGHYRYAFLGLRLFLELTLAAVQFSAYEIRYRRWLKSSQDIVWNSLVDDEEGVLSKSFVDAFFPDLASECSQYRTMARLIYRECSEYIHGNAEQNKLLPTIIEYRADLVLEWAKRAETVKMIVLFAFSARYLPFLAKSKQNDIEGVLLEDLGQLEAIRSIYAQPA